MSDRIMVGDWVCFMRDARPVYGKVEYLAMKFGYLDVYTNVGMFREDGVLEVRRATEWRREP